MKKKSLLAAIILLLIAVFVFSLTACEKETCDCTFDNGVVTKEPTHFEEGIKTYTCTVCGRTKEETVAKTNDHLFGDWYPSQENEDKHERICKCGEKETADCTFDNGVVTKESTHVEPGTKLFT
ncbi:MAG: hypothetical protein J6V22_05525, partial [Clostridia bacterium]|nr:hypothetical protein [Clostridia bacterium]